MTKSDSTIIVCSRCSSVYKSMDDLCENPRDGCCVSDKNITFYVPATKYNDSICLSESVLWANKDLIRINAEKEDKNKKFREALEKITYLQDSVSSQDGYVAHAAIEIAKVALKGES